MNSIVLLSLLGVSSMFAGIFNYRKLILPILILGLGLAAALLIQGWGANIGAFNMLVFDNYAIAFSTLLMTVTALVFLLAMYHYRHEGVIVTDLYALFIFALIGGVVMASFSNMVMLFLGIEILSIPLYVLSGSRRADLASNEASLKYFLMGAFATGFLLFGIALIYGATGTFALDGIAAYVLGHGANMPGSFYAGLIMLIVALMFKVSAAPFHFWAPDVYQGSPVLVTTFMSTVVKIAAFAAFLRVFTICFSSLKFYYEIIFTAAAVVTLLIGNITALYQQSVKRMLAYSGISHAGYLLIALVVMGASSSSVVFFYSAAYAAASVVAFAVLMAVMENKGSESFESFKGLAKNNPFLAICMTIAMLSLAGIPPLAGFFGKYYLFTTAIKGGYLWLVIVAIINSLISLYYYFRVILLMYSSADEEVPAFKGHYALAATLLIALLVNMAIGFAPDFLLSLL